MKKLLLASGSFMLIATSFLFTGCASNTESVKTNLSNQIDLLNNTVNAVSSKTEKLPTLTSLTKDQAKNYAGVYQTATDILKTQNSYKSAIIAKNGLIKNKLSEKGLKLGNQNVKALQDLTQALSRNTRSLNETKSEFNRATNEVKKAASNSKSSVSEVSAKINRLSNCMDNQTCYYKNILNTLTSIEKILGITDTTFDYSNLNNSYTDDIKPAEMQQNNAQEDHSKELEELLYQYLISNMAKNQNAGCINSENQDKQKEEKQEPTSPQINPGINPINDGYQNGAYPYNTNMPMQNYYGYSMRGWFNPYRNTDTFRPYTSNIDTYKLTRNSGNNMVAPAVASEEKQEDKSDDKIIEKSCDKTVEKSCDKVIEKAENNLQVKSTPSKKMTDGKRAKLLEIKKGHTNTVVMLDTNKTIDALLHGKAKQTFSEQNYFILH